MWLKISACVTGIRLEVRPIKIILQDSCRRLLIAFSLTDELALADCWPVHMTSFDFMGDNVAQDDGSAADCAGDPTPCIEGNGDAGFDDWKLVELGTAFVGGRTPDCDEVAEATAATVWLPWPTGVSAEETEERRDGKKASQFMHPMSHKLRKAKSKNSALGAWLQHWITRDIRTDSVTARSCSWSCKRTCKTNKPKLLKRKEEP